MALVDRMQVTFTGGQIGGGVATHYATGEGHQTAFAAFWDNVSGNLPQGVTVTVPNTGDTIEVETGLLQSVWSGGTVVTKEGPQQGPYAAGVGVCINWLTAGIVNGHRVRGRTFLVPMSATRYDNDGTVLDGALTQLRTWCDQLIANAEGNFVIYSRPVPGRDGSAHPVVSARIADRVSSLRTRR